MMPRTSQNAHPPLSRTLGSAGISPIHPNRSRLQWSTREFEEISRSSKPIKAERRITLTEEAITHQRAETIAGIKLLLVLGYDRS